jgi:hypothetical protein
VFSSMRLGVPFIAPRQLGAVESIPGRQILPSVAWRTGQSGAHRTLSDADFFPSVAQSTVGAWEPLAHPTVGSPDSPVNYSRTPPMKSREQRVCTSQPGATDTVRCTQTEQSLGCSSQDISN